MVNLSTFLAASEKTHSIRCNSSPTLARRSTWSGAHYSILDGFCVETRHSVRILCVHKHIIVSVGLLCIRIIHQMANILAKFERYSNSFILRFRRCYCGYTHSGLFHCSLFRILIICVPSARDGCIGLKAERMLKALAKNCEQKERLTRCWFGEINYPGI